MALNDTPWCGNQTKKLFLTSGQFTSTIKTSEYVGGVDTAVVGASWDGTNTPWGGQANGKLYLTSGQFTSTIKTSEYIGGVEIAINETSWDGTNTPWIGSDADKLYLTSGQFTSILKTSEYVGGADTIPTSISWDGTNTPWAGPTSDKLYLTSGQFTSTIKTSEYVGGVEGFSHGISWDGTNTLWCGIADDKLYLTSGQFTSILKTSEYVGGVDNIPTSISTNDVEARLSVVDNDTTGDVAITFPVFIIQGLGGATGSITLPLISLNADGHMEANVSIMLPLLTVNSQSGALGSITLPLLSVNATTPANNATVTLPLISLDASGRGEADIAITLPILTVSAGSLTGEIGSIAITLPILTLDAVSLIHVTASNTLPILTFNITGLQGEVGNLNVALINATPLIISARAYNGSAPECVVMNTKNFAVSEYINYGFNSMTRFNGANLIADQNGIYEQDTSDTDNAGIDDYKIKAHIKSGQIDTSVEVQQKIRNAWLSFKTDGDVRLVSRADEKATRKYLLPFNAALGGIRKRRVKFERGIRNRIFDFKIENIDGSQLEIDKLTITLEPIVSNRR